jgi:pilus assembly protein CpaB
MHEPITPEKLTGNAVGSGITMVIPDNMRAISVAVNDVSAIAGWLLPGSKGDLIVTLKDVRTEVEPISKVVLQNVPVLGNDRSLSRNENGEATAVAVLTLLVTPDDAEKVARASTEGRLHFILRSSPRAQRPGSPRLGVPRASRPQSFRP